MIIGKKNSDFIMQKKKDFTKTFILNSLNLPILKNFDDLSNQLAISKRLLFILSNNTAEHYRKFYINKQNGTKREILSPSKSLKLIQRWILKEILEKLSVSDESMAFVPKLNGINQNATTHRYSTYLLEMDLRNFFPSIDKKQVFFLFRNIGYNNLISTILASLCTYNDYLPQGGVCSPYISNLIAFKLDRRLKGLCSKRDILYTRYADDITFSCDNKLTLKKLRPIVEEIIKDEGFDINKDKTRFISPGSHKRVTGITIHNGKLKARKILKKELRALIYSSILDSDYSSKNRIVGLISHINSIEKGYKNNIINYVTNLLCKVKNNELFDNLFSENDMSNIFDEFNKNKFYKEIDVN